MDTVLSVRTLAIDLGGTKSAVALIHDDVISEHTTWTTPPTAAQALERIISACIPLVSEAAACGVSFGGPFRFATQTCVRSMHVPGWDDVAISRDLQQALGIPVMTDNDANVAALGEYELLPSTNCDPMLYVTISTGVGAAVIANGQLLRGAHGLAGELGHLPIGHKKLCNCGQLGCLERAVSGYWLECDSGFRAADYLADAEHHREWISDLAQALWSATVLLDPAVIVVGGGMAGQGDRLAEPLRAAVEAKAEQSNRRAPALRLGDPTGRTVLQGAAMLAKGAHGGSR